MISTLYAISFITLYILVYLNTVSLSLIIIILLLQASFLIVGKGCTPLLCSLLVIQGMIFIPHTINQQRTFPLEVESITRLEGRTLFDSSISENDNCVIQFLVKKVGNKRDIFATCNKKIVVIAKGEHFISHHSHLTLKGEIFLDEEGGYFFYATDICTISISPIILFRERLLERLLHTLSPLEEHSRAIGSLLLLGVKGKGSKRITTLALTNGVAHLFALSGMHLQGLLLLISLLSTRIFPQRVSTFISLGFAHGFCFIVGNKPSLSRALISLTSQSLPLRRAPIHTLLITFIIHSLFLPNEIFSLAALYSYVSIGSILILSPKLSSLLMTISPQWIATPLAFSISALFTTAPISLTLFSTFYPIGIGMSLALSPLVFFLLVLSLVYVMLPLPIMRFCLNKLSSYLIKLLAWGEAISMSSTNLSFLQLYLLWLFLLLTLFFLLWYSTKKAHNRSVHIYEMGISLRFTFRNNQITR